jgi:sigma-B regulation protein RsbU (phosphoserine phosphatase)
MDPQSILVADDQPHILEALRLLLKSEGYRIDTADSPGSVLETMERRTYDALLMDLNYARDTTSGREGLNLIRQIRQRDALTPIVVMTAWSNVALAVEAMQQGACDFVEKPWDNARVLSIVRTQSALGRAHRRAVQLEAQQRQDLELAAQIQRQLLPQECPAIGTLDCHARCAPAGAVGGDYFDFIRVDDDRMAIAVGDVAGKGVAAALLMTSLQALLRSRAAECGDDVARLIRETNERLCATIPANKYATLFYGVYSDRERSLTYVNAGHNPPLLRRTTAEAGPGFNRAADVGPGFSRADSIEWLSTGGPVVGMFADAAFAAGKVTLEPGDRLLVYTDGVTEALDAAGEEFGEDRLVAAMAAGAADAAALHAAVSRALAAFTDGVPLRDDTTLLVAVAR